MINTASKYLTVPEAAEITGRHQNTIRSWIHSGELPAARVGEKGRFLIKKIDLEAILTVSDDSN